MIGLLASMCPGAAGRYKKKVGPDLERGLRSISGMRYYAVGGMVLAVLAAVGVALVATGLGWIWERSRGKR
jgi:hypothetical protein